MNDMTNEEGNRSTTNDDSCANTNLSNLRRTLSTASGTLSNHQQPNGSVGGGFSDENNSGAEGSASDDCGDKMAKESDPLQPKMVKSRSSHKVKERLTVVSIIPERERETWGQKAEFLLAVIGFAVDLGNVWRFPYICYQNGGGAFLIPYCIMLLLGGLPLFYMELALGQFHRCGCLTIWKKICPALKGIGYAICLIDIYMGIYYNTIIGWAVYYLYASFTDELPWTSCSNEWNTPFCKPVSQQANLTNATSPAREFFERSVLEQHKSNGLDYMGPIKPSLALCVFSVFVLVYFSLWKGVRNAGKVVWVTALAPYVVLIFLLIRDVTLPGASEGIRYYLTPQWHKLKNSKVWIDAASQIFFSLGPGFGTLLALASYNKFNNNCYRDALLTSSINCLTSFLAGFVIFSVLGYMAHIQQKSIDRGGLEGPGLVFIVYPEAIAMMSGSVFWSIIFFLMLITLGIDSTFGGLEAMITALYDEYPRALGRRRELFVLVLLIGIYLCALPTTTYGGVYLVNFLNVYGPGLAILFVVFVEAAGVFWFYGVDNFSSDVEMMLGQRPGLFWRICWMYISPVFLLVIFIFSLMGYEDMLGEEYEYPEWSIALGWTLTLSSILCIPLYIVYKILITPGTITQRVSTSFKPQQAQPTEIPGQILSGGTAGGVYLVNFLNVYGPGLAILFVVFVEAAGVFWFYGVDNFSSDVEMMLGQRPGLFWRICWMYISPVFLLVIFIFSLMGYEDMLGEEYEYPEWSIALGWTLTLSSILCIPLYIVYKILITPGTITQRVSTSFKPQQAQPTEIPGQILSGGTAV